VGRADSWINARNTAATKARITVLKPGILGTPKRHCRKPRKFVSFAVGIAEGFRNTSLKDLDVVALSHEAEVGVKWKVRVDALGFTDSGVDRQRSAALRPFAPPSERARSRATVSSNLEQG
jgi:hypothetical protein